MRRRLRAVATLGVLVACSSPVSESAAPTIAPAPISPPPATARPVHPQVDGRDFPDHVLSLSWDDGPDTNTVALARYLSSLRVSATFFVVKEWAPQLSDEPGVGLHPFETGFAHIPVLGDLVALGHRLGNHTAHHVVLPGKGPAVVDAELRDNQRSLDPYLKNELRLFRAPGGAWDDETGRAIDDDPALAGLVGPVRWDVDRKDWEGSLYCRSERPRAECEPALHAASGRVRASVTASRYLESINQAGHGIVLFHDRVGDVGSDYALVVARQVVPALLARGYVLAAPVLAFGAFRPRAANAVTAEWALSLDASTVTFVDVDGDGRADLCGRGTGGFGCARSVELEGKAFDRRPRTAFEWDASLSAPVMTGGAQVALAGSAPMRGDLNGDGHVDECNWVSGGARCALSDGHKLLGASVWLSADSGMPQGARLALADINGDGRADLCGVRADGVGCALAP